MKALVLPALVIALLVESGVLVWLYRDRGREADRLDAIAQKRSDFCTSYRGLMQITRRDLSHQGSEDAKTQAMHNFLTLASEPFFVLCQINDSTIRDEVERAHECYRVRADYGCVADVAGRIVSAVPQTSEH